MRRLFRPLLAGAVLAVLPLGVVTAAPTTYLPPATHETTVRAEWDLASQGAASTPDTFLTAWTPSTVPRDGAASVTGVFSTNRFTCDASSDTWRFRWSYGTFDAGRGVLTFSGQGASLTATLQVETRETAGSGCATADRYGTPGTLIADGTATISAIWAVQGAWDAARSCWLNQARDVLHVGTSRSTDEVAASMTVTGVLTLTVADSRLTSGSLTRAMETARPNTGQWPCRPTP